MRSTRPAAAIRRSRPLAAAASALVGVSLVAAPAVAAADPDDHQQAAPPVVATVTLITGDVVRLSTHADGSQSAVLQPHVDGTVPEAAITEVAGHLHVVPTEAFGLLETGRLDRDLFDVTQLVADGYDDASQAVLPLIVDYGRGATAAREATVTRLAAARRTVTLPSLGMTAYRADKSRIETLWSDLTRGADAAGHPTALDQGAARVHLDGRVRPTLEDSVPQIHAPEAWDLGYDGSGVTVAVLDTGYDPTHPDLAGQVSDSANFTPDATVVDGNGHGTHVASTIAGRGAASTVVRKGAAPGADLLVGKVLSDIGFGEDSWVLAGMQWAVDEGADVVSMSLGGDADDGTGPLAQAVNDLSASSDTLFVIAAGNNGDTGPTTVTAPGTADAALTVGAVDVHDAMASFSGRGPRLRDGALKPEVVAPGVDVTAARASGTELGPVVDDYYISISGTSMATPHVAGLAAILKQRHPGWDGERLKSVIANSTVPVADATGFDAGTGRVDALRALEATVVAPASLGLGNYAWPYDTLDPQSTELTYVNTTDEAVTLDLALAGQDGSPEPTGSMELGADTVVVPADGEASVNVVVDPTQGDPGAYSAVVTATTPGGATVRTGVAYQLEPERYDVTVTVQPREGTSSAGHQIGLAGFDEPWPYEQRTLDSAPGSRSVTFRLPPGRYSTGVITSAVAADGSTEGVVTYDPFFTVDGDVEVVLDENAAELFDYSVDRPTLSEGAILDVGFDTEAGRTGFLYYGSADRVYARPSAGLGGSADVATTWLLSQPDGELTLDEAAGPVALRAVVPSGLRADQVGLGDTDAVRRVVDVGSVGARAPLNVRGAVVLATGSCQPVDGLARTLATERAAALVVRPAPGAACGGTLAGPAPIPVLQASGVDGPALEAATAARLVTRSAPGYMYDLVRHHAGGVPAGATLVASDDRVAAVTEAYRGMGSSSRDGLVVAQETIGWVPSRGGAANVGLVRRVPFPGAVTHYLNTNAGIVWERTVTVQDAEYGGEYARIWGGRRSFDPGQQVTDTWFGGPVGARVSPLQSLANGAPPPVREIAVDPATGEIFRDEMFLSQGAYTDAAGHLGHSDLFETGYSGRIYADGELVVDAFASVFLNSEVPTGKHRFRIVSDFSRENLFWQRSTRIRTAWGFTSDTPSVDQVRTVLPMIGVDHRMPLSARGFAPAGRFTYEVGFTLPAGARPSPVLKRTVEVSWDGGASWREARLSQCDGDSCQVTLTNRAGGLASLRVTAEDAAGRTVRQKLVDAYGVR